MDVVDDEDFVRFEANSWDRAELGVGREGDGAFCSCGGRGIEGLSLLRRKKDMGVGWVEE